MKTARRIEEIKLEWQQHNRDHGLSWNEVAELVNECANYARCTPTDGEIEKLWRTYSDTFSNADTSGWQDLMDKESFFEAASKWMREQQGEGDMK